MTREALEVALNLLVEDQQYLSAQGLASKLDKELSDISSEDIQELIIARLAVAGDGKDLENLQDVYIDENDDIYLYFDPELTEDEMKALTNEVADVYPDTKYLGRAEYEDEHSYHVVKCARQPEEQEPEKEGEEAEAAEEEGGKSKEGKEGREQVYPTPEGGAAEPAANVSLRRESLARDLSMLAEGSDNGD